MTARPTTPPSRAVAAATTALRRMPDPFASREADAYDRALAQAFGVRHALCTSSGTAALHLALLAAGIGAGDEVLVPALAVPMSIAPLHYIGAVPVFVDCPADGVGLDLEDAAAKLTDRTRAVLPVHLWGRAPDPAPLAAFARRHGLVVVEDACQAHGTRVGGRLAGTGGDVGCFSTKDGKLLWSGEGGFLVTDDDRIADQARALRNHYLTPPARVLPLSRVGFNHRLAEPLAAYAHGSLRRFDELLERRRAQAATLAELLSGLSRLTPITPAPGWNGYSALFELHLDQPRAFATLLAARGVANSVGTFHLTPADRRPALTVRPAAPCRRAEHVIDTTLAVVVHHGHRDEDLHTIAETIAKEAAAWAP
ncbi:DegT/DnrJ/EryC1/StrS family aminotransferase [Streptomyces sp. URMC 125]|uniref:DegT/DnrJ/EryC1/StrS family aminotransferase n=1 Tax=Streptomyces sp. URMC 125 TaxID=3423419 RepID=UPI003F1B71FB